MGRVSVGQRLPGSDDGGRRLEGLDLRCRQSNDDHSHGVHAPLGRGERVLRRALRAGVEGEAGERPRFVAPIRGPADIAYLAPDTTVESGEVVTKIVLQNRATGAIAGLKVDEFWWDASRNPLPGDSQRLRQPLMPGEVAIIELRVPRDNRMNQNQYSFSHANGAINATLVTELPDPEPDPEEEPESGETES